MGSTPASTGLTPLSPNLPPFCPPQAVLKFHETYYSADIMKLAVIGRQPLDRLEAWVADLFSNVRNTNQPSHFSYPVPAFDASRLGIRLSVVPIKEMRRLTMTFPLPLDWEAQRAMQVSQTKRWHGVVW